MRLNPKAVELPDRLESLIRLNPSNTNTGSSRGPRRSVQVDIPRERYNVENLNVANARVHSGQYLHYVIPIAVCYMALILLMNFGREYSPRSQLFGQVLALPMLELGL